MSRARCCWIWPSAWRSVGTAWPMWRSYARHRKCSVASDPTVSRLIDRLAADAPAALAAIAAARATARGRAWALAGDRAPDHHTDSASPLVIDVDATLVGAHSEKERAAPIFKRGLVFHPWWPFADQGPEGPGDPLAF